MFEYLVFSWWNCLGGIESHGLVRESVATEVSFEVSKDISQRAPPTSYFWIKTQAPRYSWGPASAMPLWILTL